MKGTDKCCLVTTFHLEVPHKIVEGFVAGWQGLLLSKHEQSLSTKLFMWGLSKDQQQNRVVAVHVKVSNSLLQFVLVHQSILHSQGQWLVLSVQQEIEGKSM